MGRPVAVVTGASRGIGKAIALQLAEEGYDLVITCKTRTDLLDEVAEEIQTHGVHCLGVQCDVRNYYEVKELFSHPSTANCQLLVNNAGISYIGLLTDMTPDDWRTLMATNLDSLYNTCSAVIPMMVSRKEGCILNISSIWGSDGASCEVAYSASKGAVNSFTKALAKELAPSGIRVNAVACGAIDTDMNRWLTEEDRKSLIEDISLGRLGRSEDIAAAVAFIASDKASYITGQIITIDGGM